MVDSFRGTFYITTNLFSIVSVVVEYLYFFLFTAAVLYYYLYKRTAEYMGDPRLYEDSLWLRDAFARARQ